MPLRLYLDDCANDRRLIEALRSQPYRHDVQIPADVGLKERDDDEHFAHARAAGRILVTKDPRDFRALHDAQPDHRGLFAIYQDNDRRDMSPLEIARAIQSLVESGLPIAGGFHRLNHWRRPR